MARIHSGVINVDPIILDEHRRAREDTTLIPSTGSRAEKHCTIGNAIPATAIAADDQLHVHPAETVISVKRVEVQGEALELWIRAEGLASLVGELREHDERKAA